MNTHYLEFEVTLLDIEPRLWRRFLLRHRFSFLELHGARQIACGFCHLYEFVGDDCERIARAPLAHDAFDAAVPSADAVPLNVYFTSPGRQCLYIYDFGDYWQHRVKFPQKVTLQERFAQRLTSLMKAIDTALRSVTAADAIAFITLPLRRYGRVKSTLAPIIRARSFVAGSLVVRV